MDFIVEILFANSGAIFMTHLESQLRPIRAQRTPYLLLLGMAQDVLRQASSQRNRALRAHGAK